MTKLTFPPLKQIKIPDRLIYGNGSAYRLADVTTGTYLGKMNVATMTLTNNPYYKNDKPVKSLYISNLWIKPFARLKNAGSDFVKFAKHLSYKNDCNGRIHLVAYNYEHPGVAPHKFWRKMGFETSKPDENKILDFVIENDLPVPPYMTQGTTMFFNNKLKGGK
uniref:hypothetical protein n=1 Tax=Candidatus Scatousia sp. TaxID=3085663 RepID=UPI0040269BC1